MPEAPKPPQYALVAYVRGPLGRFVESLRAELDPLQAHLAAHITVLPPRELRGSERKALQDLRSAANKFTSFDVQLGEVASFMPATPTVFIRVENGADTFREMHVVFNAGTSQCEEPWPYVPHFTIAKMRDLASAAPVLQKARERWAAYSGNKVASITELTFVREAQNDRWLDLHMIQLQAGGSPPGL